jgi:hypothetical protein
MNGPTIADLATLRTVIAHSQIYVPLLPATVRPLPSGFDAADVAILEWIAADARRARRPLAVM